jgi:transcriptional regulator with XRE-family HTH domain
MVERILLVLKVKNLSPSKFADEIGIQRSSMSHIMSGRNLPSLDLVTKVMNKFPDINPEWLLMGIGQMIKSKQIDLFEVVHETGEMKTENINEELEKLPIEDKVNEVNNNPVQEKASEKDLKTQKNKDNSVQKEDIKPEIIEKIIPSSLAEIEKIVILYKNKTFKEYYPSL